MKFKNFRLVIPAFLLFSSCGLFSRDIPPYLAKGEMVMDNEAEEYEIAGLKLFFLNQSQATIKEFTLVFYMFDEDGEPVDTGRNNVVLSIEEEIAPSESIDCCLSLDKYLAYIPEVPFEIDYLYVSEIIYVDGTTWKDPLGMVLR